MEEARLAAIESSRDDIGKVAKKEVNEDDVAALASIMDVDENRVISEEPLEDEPMEDDAAAADKAMTKNLGYNRFLIACPWTTGAARLEKDNVYKARVEAVTRTERKKRTYRAVMTHVRNDGNKVASMITKERKVQQPEWTQKAMDIFPEFYKTN